MHETLAREDVLGVANSTESPSEHTEAPAPIEWTRLDEIRNPGAYVCRDSGDLVRVPATGPTVDSEQITESHDSAPIFVTQISGDPYIPISRARMETANLDIEVNF